MPNIAALFGEVRRLEVYTNASGDVLSDLPDGLYDRILAAGYCPDCARYATPKKLRHMPATVHEYAANTCPECEEAFDVQVDSIACGPDYGGAFDGYSVTSDADPGL